MAFCPFCSGDRLADKLPLPSVSCGCEDARRCMLHEPDRPASVLVKEVTMLGSKRTALRAIAFSRMHHTPRADIQISRLNTCIVVIIIIIITTTTTTIITMQVKQPEYSWPLNHPPVTRWGLEHVELYIHSPLLLYSTQCLRNGKTGSLRLLSSPTSLVYERCCISRVGYTA